MDIHSSPSSSSATTTTTTNNSTASGDPIVANTAASANGSEPLFQIKKLNLIAFWKWDVQSDVCAICRANVMEACPTCQSENKTSDCVIVWGACNHSFHNCCIVKWVKRNNRCPLCQQEWMDFRKRQLN
uniref:RING-box protein 2 n=1 Tax=Aceria tosichella TaxID=561515 RepID=A0A6G1SIG9_9ACAR